MPSVLIVEDDPDAREFMQAARTGDASSARALAIRRVPAAVTTTFTEFPSHRRPPIAAPGAGVGSNSAFLLRGSRCSAS